MFSYYSKPSMPSFGLKYVEVITVSFFFRPLSRKFTIFVTPFSYTSFHLDDPPKISCEDLARLSYIWHYLQGSCNNGDILQVQKKFGCSFKKSFKEIARKYLLYLPDISSKEIEPTTLYIVDNMELFSIFF